MPEAKVPEGCCDAQVQDAEEAARKLAADKRYLLQRVRDVTSASGVKTLSTLVVALVALVSVVIVVVVLVSMVAWVLNRIGCVFNTRTLLV